MNAPRLLPGGIRNIDVRGICNNYSGAVSAMGLGCVMPALDKWRARELVLIHQQLFTPENDTREFDEIVINAVCEVFEISISDFMQKSRVPKLNVMPRQVAVKIFREKTAYTWEKIGRICGKQDHANAIHSAQKVDIALGYKHKDILAENYKEVMSRLMDVECE
jgi:chromosomal replication initiation ATPase DnaA